ncbi:MAG: molybdenum cofactor biosynthesis protein B [Porticoccaceae bacterium]|nr:molybdenum cofactor biosynthesis protein B [Porticoccaceae bacterium]
MVKNYAEEFRSLRIAVLTVSDSRNKGSDTSGKLLVEKLSDAGHQLVLKQIVKDDLYNIRAIVATWIASEDIQAILITGGTGFTGRDSTPQAILPLFDTVVDGYGELFRQISYKDIGSSTVQSRAVAGLSNGTIVFCMPGSTNACRTAWDGIIGEQLDASHKPCNFVGQLKTIAGDKDGNECSTREAS